MRATHLATFFYGSGRSSMKQHFCSNSWRVSMAAITSAAALFTVIRPRGSAWRHRGYRNGHHPLCGPSYRRYHFVFGANPVVHPRFVKVLLECRQREARLLSSTRLARPVSSVLPLSQLPFHDRRRRRVASCVSPMWVAMLPPSGAKCLLNNNGVDPVFAAHRRL